MTPWITIDCLAAGAMPAVPTEDPDRPARKCGADGQNQFCCTRCGERFPAPLGDPRWVAALTEAFAAVHADCSERNSPCSSN